MSNVLLDLLSLTVSTANAIRTVDRELAGQTVTPLSQEGLFRSQQKLFALDKAQGEEITRLRAVVNVLVDMLVEARVIPEDTLYDRIRTAVEPPEPPPTEKSPAEKPPELFTCVNCGRQVGLSEATRAAEGVVCGQCFSRKG